jgi:hypothetical protein
MWQKPDPNTYYDLRTLIRKKIQQNGPANQKMQAAFSTLSGIYEQELTDRKIVLSHPERQRLLKDLLQELLTEFITEYK